MVNIGETKQLALEWERNFATHVEQVLYRELGINTNAEYAWTREKINLSLRSTTNQRT